MRKPEQLLWDWLRRRLDGHWFVQRVENTVGVGQPDLYFSTQGARGWIELKSIPKWPADSAAVFRLPGWSTEQRNWMESHLQTGGRSWLLVQVEQQQEVVLLPDHVALTAVDRWSCETVRRLPWTGSKRTYSTEAILADLRSAMV